MKYIYDIYGILKIKSDIELSLNNSFTPTLDYFLTDENIGDRDADLLITCKKSKEIHGLDTYNRISNGLYYSSDRAHLLSVLKFFNISVCWKIKNLLERTSELEFNKMYQFFSKFIKIPISSVYPLCLLIRNILQLKLLLKQGTFLVGSSIIADDKCFIFTGTYGSGKTSMVLNLMKNDNVNFLSDDLMILYNNSLYGIPSLISYRQHNFGLFCSHGYLDPLQEFKGRVKTVFNKKGRCEVYFLETSSKQSVNRISICEGIKKMQSINNIIHSYFCERLLSYIPFLHNDYSIISTQKKQFDILSEFFMNSKFFILSGNLIQNYKKIKDKLLTTK